MSAINRKWCMQLIPRFLHHNATHAYNHGMCLSSRARTTQHELPALTFTLRCNISDRVCRTSFGNIEAAMCAGYEERDCATGCKALDAERCADTKGCMMGRAGCELAPCDSCGTDMGCCDAQNMVHSWAGGRSRKCVVKERMCHGTRGERWRRKLWRAAFCQLPVLRLKYTPIPRVPRS